MSSAVGSLNAAALRVIRDLRKPRVTQHELAQAIGIDQPYYSKIENGWIKPGTELVEAIAEHLGIPVGAITNPRPECPECANKVAA